MPKFVLVFRLIIFELDLFLDNIKVLEEGSRLRLYNMGDFGHPFTFSIPFQTTVKIIWTDMIFHSSRTRIRSRSQR